MKKYSNLGSLLLDYRNFHNLTQLDLAEILEVDARTIARWEKNVTLVHPEKEKFFVENLSLPHQVVHNLNSELPLAIFYDIERRMYSHSALGSLITNMQWFKEDYPVEVDRFRKLMGKDDAEFISLIKNSTTDHRSRLDKYLMEMAQERLPELNFMVNDQSGFYAAYSCVLPLKMATYMMIRSQEMTEEEIRMDDLAPSGDTEKVFYLYSLYADSVPNAYYVLNPLFGFFKKNKFKNYTVAGMVYRDFGVNLFGETGLRALWHTEEPYTHTLLQGDFDMFLFGKVN